MWCYFAHFCDIDNAARDPVKFLPCSKGEESSSRPGFPPISHTGSQSSQLTYSQEKPAHQQMVMEKNCKFKNCCGLIVHGALTCA